MKKHWLSFGVFLLLAGSWACKSSSDREDAAAENDLSTAIVHLQQAVKMNPDSAGLRYLLMDRLLQNRQLKEALLENDTLLYLDSSNAGLWYKRGIIELQGGDTVSGMVSLKRALQDAPVFSEALLELAAVYANRSDSEAIKVGDQIINSTEDVRTASQARFIKGLYYSNINDKKKAEKQFDDCIKNDYTFLDAYIEKGLLLYDQKQYTEALQVFGRAIQVSHTFAEAYYQTGRCMEALGNKDEAKLNYQKALGLDKDFRAAKEALKKMS